MLHDPSFIPKRIPKRPTTLTPETQAVIDDAEAYMAMLRTKGPDVKRQRKVFKKHLSALNSAGVDERGFQWLRTRTLLCAFFRTDDRFVRRFNTKIIQYLEAREGPEAAGAFKASVHEAMAPYRLSAHGYWVPFSARDGAAIAQVLKDRMAEIEKITGCKVFINSGTLLGALRSGTFIPHDDDIDLGIHLGDEGEGPAVARWREAIEKLDAAGYMNKKNMNMALVKVKPIDGIKIDIFPAWSSQGRYYVWPHTYGDVAETDVMPRKKMALHGVMLDAPANPDPLIAQNYGPNWNDTDDDFRFRWRRARQRFATFFDLWRDAQKAD
ncbi:MAG: LicD family protein [Pseudomonadota bacterium]